MRIVLLLLLIIVLKYVSISYVKHINPRKQNNKRKCKQISKLSLKSNFPRYLLFMETNKEEPVINKKSLNKIIMSKTKGIQAYQSGEYSEFEVQ